MICRNKCFVKESESHQLRFKKTIDINIEITRHTRHFFYLYSKIV